MTLIDELCSHSNFTAICTKFKIGKSDLDLLVHTNLLVPIIGETNSNNLEYGLVDAFRKAIVQDSNFYSLAGVYVLGNEKFAELIAFKFADCINRLLKIENDNGGWKSWISRGMDIIYTFIIIFIYN